MAGSNDALAELEEGIRQVRRDLGDLEGTLPNWDSGSKAGAKEPRAIARQLVLAAQRLETLVKKHTFG